MMTALLVSISTCAVASDAETVAVGTTSQVWLISTRCAPRCGDLAAGMQKVTYWRSACACGSGAAIGNWKQSDSSSFAASADSTMPTIVLVHGNDTDESWAVEHGSLLNSNLRSISGGRPYRLVIWSWPSGKVALRPKADVQTKVEYSEPESYYMAHVLATVAPGSPISLISFSLGSRVIGGTLQLLAGGTFDGRTLAPQTLAAWRAESAHPLRVMFLAAAMNADFLDHCGPAPLAAATAERVFVSLNDCDRVLKYWPKLYGRYGPEAMGYAGPTGPCDKLEVVDVSCQVGKRHNFDQYQSSSEFLGRLSWYAYLTGEVVAAK